MTAIPALAGRPVGQIGLVVRDLDAAMEHYVSALGLRPWRCWTYGPDTVPDLGYRGERGEYVMRIALCGADPQLELIEPLRGPSIYHEWLEEHGEGLHHIAVYVDSLEGGLAEMAAAGHSPVQHGRGYGARGDGGFAYFDLRPALATYLELIEVPAERVPPEQTYPA